MNKIKFGQLNLIRNIILGNYNVTQPKVDLTRYLNYKTPVNRPKVFTPTTLPVTNANKHLKVVLSDNKDVDLGEMRLEKAKELAESKNLKLVIVEENSTPPKFKLMSGKELHELQMKYRDTNRENTKETKVKEIEVNLGIDDHDLDIKLKMLRNFYDKGYTVKFKISSRILNKKEKNIPKLQEDFIKKIKTIVTFGKLELEKQTENIIIFSLEAEKSKKE